MAYICLSTYVSITVSLLSCFYAIRFAVIWFLICDTLLSSLADVVTLCFERFFNGQCHKLLMQFNTLDLSTLCNGS